jgi:predicted Zn-dependent peptidase
MRTFVAILGLLSAASVNAQVKLPKYAHEVLANGVTVDLLPRGEFPLVNIEVLVKGGNEAEPLEQAGISDLTVQMLREGTAKRSADDFSDQLDALGGSWRAASTAQAARISAQFLSKDFDQGFDLVADALLHPSFPDGQLTKLRSRMVDQVRSEKDQAQQAISRYSNAFYFGSGHPYGRIADEATLGSLDRAKVADFYAHNYTGANIIVIVAGRFDENAAKAAIARTFGAIPAGQPFQWAADPATPTASGNRLLLIDKPDATQTYFTISMPGINRTNPDRSALWLVNTLFGGRFTSLLNDALRVNSGLTYGASSNYQQDKLTGALRISTYTKTDTTVQAIDMVLDVTKKLRETGVTPEQLASARATVEGTYPTRSLETPGELAGQLGDIELFGLNRGEVDDLFSSLDAVTVEKADAVIRKYLQPDGLTFTVLGNASRIREQVKKYAPAMVEVAVSQPGFMIR